MNHYFISYRRDDAGAAAGRIAEILSRRYGDDAVFFDVDRLSGGERWFEALENAVRDARISIVVIGSQWLTLADPDGVVRIHADGDVVRHEIALALASERRHRDSAEERAVVPLLIGRAGLPHRDALPEDLAELAADEVQAIQLEDEDLGARFEALLIERLGDVEDRIRLRIPTRRSVRLRQAAAATLLLTIAISTAWYFLRPGPDDPLLRVAVAALSSTSSAGGSAVTGDGVALGDELADALEATVGPSTEVKPVAALTGMDPNDPAPVVSVFAEEQGFDVVVFGFEEVTSVGPRTHLRLLVGAEQLGFSGVTGVHTVAQSDLPLADPATGVAFVEALGPSGTRTLDLLVALELYATGNLGRAYDNMMSTLDDPAGGVLGDEILHLFLGTIAARLDGSDPERGGIGRARSHYMDSLIARPSFDRAELALAQLDLREATTLGVDADRGISVAACDSATLDLERLAAVQAELERLADGSDASGSGVFLKAHALLGVASHCEWGAGVTSGPPDVADGHYTVVTDAYETGRHDLADWALRAYHGRGLLRAATAQLDEALAFYDEALAVAIRPDLKCVVLESKHDALARMARLDEAAVVASGLTADCGITVDS